MTPEICTKCGLTYGGGNHQVDDSGRFTLGGHYFEEENSEEE